MTLRELSVYYKLCEQLERNREMLSSLCAKAGPGAQVLTGMPHTPGVSDKVSGLAIEIGELKERIAQIEMDCEREKRKLEKYVGNIQDDQTRMIFRLRFLRCMTWSQVADTIGGKNSERSVKAICYRYLKSCSAV